MQKLLVVIISIYIQQKIIYILNRKIRLRQTFGFNIQHQKIKMLVGYKLQQKDPGFNLVNM